MTAPFKMERIDIDLALRAFAISLVPLNHANPATTVPLGLGGGMTVLMMLSGYNFARFSMRDASGKDIRMALLRLSKNLLVPSAIAVVFFFIIMRDFSMSELLFFSNWITVDRISKFPTWYPQVMVQMLLAIFVLFSIPGVARFFRHSPLPASVAFCLVALAMRFFLPQFWNTEPLRHQLPQLFLWNFTLGWVLYFFVQRAEGTKSVSSKVMAAAIGVLSAMVAWEPQQLQFWMLSVSCLVLVWVPKVLLPHTMCVAIQVLAQAAFAIFLLHRFFFEVYEDVFSIEDARGASLYFFGMVLSVGTWVAWAAARRAFRTTRLEMAKKAAVLGRAVSS